MPDNELDRIAALEARVTELEAELLRQRTLIRSPDQPPPPIPGPAAPPRPAAARPRSRHSIDSETLLKWGGITLVVLAIAFAVSTAISRGWIGPELQLVGALGVSAGLAVVGLRVRTSRPRWMHTLCSGGAIGPFLIGASDLFVDLTSDEAGLVFVGGATLVGYALAVHSRSVWVGLVTLAASAITPLTLGLTDDPAIAFAIWGSATAALALAAAVRRPLPSLDLAAHVVVMVWLIGAATMTNAPSSRAVVLALVAATLASLHVTPSSVVHQGVSTQLLTRLAALAAPWLLLIISISYDPTTDNLAAIAFGIAVGGTAFAFVAQRLIARPHFIALLVGASATLSLGLTFLLGTSPTALALAVQGVGLLLLARALDASRAVLANGLLLLAIAAAVGLGSMADAWDVDASTGIDIVHGGIIACLVSATVLLTIRSAQVAAAAVTLLAAMVWLGSFLVHLPQGQALVSIAWTIVGVTILLAGARNRQPIIGYVGMAVLGVTVTKLLSIDLREVDTLWRAGLFMAIGLGFLRLGFVLPALMDREATTPSDTST